MTDSSPQFSETSPLIPQTPTDQNNSKFWWGVGFAAAIAIISLIVYFVWPNNNSQASSAGQPPPAGQSAGQSAGQPPAGQPPAGQSAGQPPAGQSTSQLTGQPTGSVSSTVLPAGPVVIAIPDTIGVTNANNPDRNLTVALPNATFSSCKFDFNFIDQNWGGDGVYVTVGIRSKNTGLSKIFWAFTFPESGRNAGAGTNYSQTITPINKFTLTSDDTVFAKFDYMWAGYQANLTSFKITLL